jgi:putative hemolysin
MKTKIMIFGLLLGVLLLASCTSQNQNKCSKYYWFDDTNKECGQKEFCGMFMYQSLRTFGTKEECVSASKENTQIANPASVYCKEQGGTLKIVEEEAGQRGICVLKDNTECDEWAYFRKECPVSTTPETPAPENVSAFTKIMTYQPKQCQKTPWQEWYESGEIQFVKAPTEKELATTFFSHEYQTEILGFEKVESGKIVCEACDVCATTYYYKITIKGGDIEKVKSILESS